jgi:hypothetical protein
MIVITIRVLGERKTTLKFKALAIVMLLVTSVFGTTLIFPVASWHTPSSTDDILYEEFGPRPSQIAIKIYSDYAAVLAAFKNKEIDIMDWPLELTDYQWFEKNDPTHAQYSTALYNEFGIFQYDINNEVLPTSVTSVRQALAHIVDKDYFIKTYLPDRAGRADYFLSSLLGWSPPLSDLYNLQPRTTMTPLPDDPLDWEAAYNLLVADLGPPVPDPENPGYFMFWWPSPFPTPDPLGQFPPVADGHLLFFASQEPARTQQGLFFKDCCETALPAILADLGLPPTRIRVDLLISPRPIIQQQVFVYHRFHLYTGAWNLAGDPGAPRALAMFTAGQYYGWYSALFDYEVTLMLNAQSPGERVNHAKQAQEIMHNDEPLICMWYLLGYKAYLANWRGIVNEVGTGINSWWTFLNAHKLGSESCDTIRYGWQSDLTSLNVIGTGGMYWDLEAFNKIYDTLIEFNPYNITEDRHWIASNWTIGTWQSPPPPPSADWTKILFHLREDAWWQDVPTNPSRTWPELRKSFTNMQLTPVDVAFSIEYQRDNPNSWNGWLAENIDHVSINLEKCWNSSWPWTVPGGAVPPWWNRDPSTWQFNFVQNDPTLGANDILVYFNINSPWLDTLYQIGVLPIIPYHIWKWIPIDGSESIDPWAEDLVYGSGPWILLDRQPGLSMTMIPFRNGQTYRGITLEKSYFAALPVQVANYPQYQVGINGRNIVFKAAFVGVDRMFAHGLDYYWTWGLRWGANWEASSNGTSKTYTTGYIGFGQQLSVSYAIPVPLELRWCKYIKIHFDLHWRIAYCSNPIEICNFIGLMGNLEEGSPACSNWYSTTLHIHPGDIAGKSSVPLPGGYWDFPYFAADGKCDIKDVSVIGVHWLHRLPPLGDPHPGGTYTYDVNDASGWCRRADINCDGVIDIKDATAIGIDWMKTWSHNPPF